MTDRKLAALDAFKTAAKAAQPKAGSLKAFLTPASTLRPDPDQPRTTFGGDEDDALAQQLRDGGQILSPLIVRTDPDDPNGYLIIAGERRWRAATEAGKTEVPVLLRDDLAGADMRIVQLVENLQRSALAPLDTARGLSRILAETTDLSQADLARRLGVAPSFVAKHLALLKAGSTTVEALEEGLIVSSETAREFDKLPEPVKARVLSEHREAQTPIPRGTVTQIAKSLPPPTLPVPSSVGGADPAPEPRRRGRPVQHERLTHLPALTRSQLQALCAHLDLPVPSAEVPFDAAAFLSRLSS